MQKLQGREIYEIRSGPSLPTGLVGRRIEIFVVVNAHRGLYQYTRLPFGVASAPAVFQHIMERALQGIPRVICYLDDILIRGKDDQEHLTNLEAVLKRLQDFGHRLKTKQVPVDAYQSGIFGLLHTSTRTQYRPSENPSNQGSTSTTQCTRTEVVLGTGKLLRSFLEESFNDL